MSVCTCGMLNGTDELVCHFDWLCLKKEIKMHLVELSVLRGELYVVFCKKCYMKLSQKPKMCMWFADLRCGSGV